MTDPHEPSARDRDALLADAFHPNWASGAPLEFARAAAKAARQRRAARRSVAGFAAAAALLLLALAVSRPGSSASRPARTITETPPSESGEAEAAASASARVPASGTRGYEIISDEELLAQVRDRTLLAVTRADGRRAIVVLPNE
jgi:hypothetical protein